MQQHRHLAAILFADIAGYTAMMQVNEQMALELLNRFETILEEITPKYKGQIVHYFGDGCVLTFDSSTDSVDCAIALQKAFSIKTSIVPVRIGLHLGDVVFKNDNVFGDGVNIASRIETLGIPGAILMSKTIRDQLKNKSDFLLSSLGYFDFKNVSEPMEVFALANPGFVVPKRQEMHGKLKDIPTNKSNIKWLIAIVLVMTSMVVLWFLIPPKKSTELIDKKSIAVLPFNNLSNDQDEEYFNDGMTEAIITDLAKRKDFLVIALNSTLPYKGKSVDVKEVGEELNVRYILEGSVQRTTTQFRINVKLVDVTTGYQIWADRYDKQLKDIFTVQDDISRNIMTALDITFNPEQANITKLPPPTTHIDAYDTFLLGLYYKRKTSRLDNDKAIHNFEKAVMLDPQFALAYAKLANSYTRRYFAFDPKKEWEEKAFIAAEKALALDPNLAEAYHARGAMSWTLSNKFLHEVAIKDYIKAIKLNHNLPEAHLDLGNVYQHIGLMDKGLKEIDSAQIIDPNFNVWFQQSMTYLNQGKYEKVLSKWEKSRGINEYFGWPILLALSHLERDAEALALASAYLKKDSINEVILSDYAVLLAKDGDFKKAEEQIAKSIQYGHGKGHFHHVQYNIGTAYALIGKKDQALEWLQQAADEGLPCYPNYEKDPYLNKLRSDPRFILFMEKLKKQLEYYKKTY